MALFSPNGIKSQAPYVPEEPALTKLSPELSSKARKALPLNKTNASLRASGKHSELSSEEVSTKVTWADFTQNTTVHGIKYVFEDGSHVARRVLWFLCMAASVAYFVIVVATRVEEYLKYRSSVNVERVYVDRMTFPAVTICNQNKFRITAVAEKGLYGYITDVYTDKESVKNVTSYPIKEISADEFVVASAHQLDDLIESCTWRGKSCKDSYWTTTQTDMGVCYTFNAKQPALQVNVSGADLGLSLVLNIEQYEYMLGPQSDAGVKILLHEQTEFPMIKDLGFGVAPGMHTVVGINRAQIESLPPPYGLCNVDALPMSDCRIQCLSAQILEHCGCKDRYWTDSGKDATELCDMSQTFGCVRERLEEENADCSCDITCHRVSYRPLLSYGQLSRQGVGRMVLKNSARRVSIQKQLELARDTFQKVDRETSEMDTAALTTIKENAEALRKWLLSVTQNIATGNIEGKIKDLREALQSDQLYLRDDVAGQIEQTIHHLVNGFVKCRTLNCLLGLPSLVQFTRGMKYHMDSELAMQQYLTECVSVFAAASQKASSHHGLDNATLAEKMGATLFDCLRLTDMVPFLLTLPEVYSSAIGVLYPETLDEALVDWHEGCLYQLARLNDTGFVSQIAELKHELFLLFIRIYKPAETVGNYARVVELMDGTFPDDLLEVYTQSVDHCTRVEKLAPDLTAITDILKYAIIAVANVEPIYLSYQKTINKILDLLSSNLKQSLVAINQYLMGNCTKLDMVLELQSFSTQTGLSEMEVSFKYLSSLEGRIKEKLQATTETIDRFYKKLAAVHIPVLAGHPQRIDNLKILELALSLENQKIDKLYAKVYSDPEISLSHITKEIVQAIEEPLVPGERASVEIIESLASYIQSVEDYPETMVMDESFFLANFLHVDLFYPELSSEIVVQAEAFLLGSLLGEVGGYMGLFLGGSVLTLAELVDYICISISTSLTK